MALTTVDFNSYFDYSAASKKIRFTDKTDFAGQGTVAGNVTVVAKVTAPVSGVFYNNTDHGSPDIDCGTSLDSVIDILLPLDAGTGLPEQGEYTIQLTYQDLVVPATVVESRTFTLNYTSPSLNLTTTVDCVSPLLKSEDKTDYTHDLVDPTVTRAMSINYPLSIGLSAVTGTASTLSTSTLYAVTGKTLEYSTTLTSTISYLFDATNSMYVEDEITKTEFFGVSCDGDLCSIYCAVKSQYQRWQNSINANSTQTAIERAKFMQVTSIMKMVAVALKCGKSEDVSGYVSKILDIADADGGCGCSDGEPVLVTGLGSGGDSIVVEAGVGIAVTSVDGGGTTTYTVALSSTNTTKLSNLENAIVAAGTNVSVATTSATVGGVLTKTYTVSSTDTVVESSLVRARLTLNSGAIPLISIVNQKQYGTTLTAVNQAGTGADFIDNANSASYSVWTANFTEFTIQNFSSGLAATDIYPEVHISKLVSIQDGATDYNKSNDVVANIVSIGADQFGLRFSDNDGRAINGLYLHERFTQIDLIFKINA